ncbi:MAG: metallophosphoesterase [Kiritimatiellae bacterium]|nr:metallophosphoesterase [Kiritimatiellia bacterium]
MITVTRSVCTTVLVLWSAMGHGAVSPTNAIDSTSGLLYHLDAALGVTTGEFGNVTHWADRSTNHNDFVGAETSTVRLIAREAAFNGLPVLSFGGAIRNPLALNSRGKTAKTVIIVQRTTASTGFEGIWGVADTDLGIRRNAGRDSQGWAVDKHVASIHVNGIADNTVDAIQAVNTAGILVACGDWNMYSSTSLGGYFPYYGGRNWKGQIAEVAVYDRVLTGAERATITDCLGRKYNIPITPSVDLEPFAPGSWSLVLLPDTQNYSEQYPGMFAAQTSWIVQNKDRYDIRYVLHLGDLVNCGTAREWQHAKAAMSLLDGKVPYAIAHGNHDATSYKDMIAGKSLLGRYFPVAKFASWPTFGGAMDGDTANSFHLFSAGGTDWIVLALEWAPRNKTVQWAHDVLAKYPDRKAILATHAYLYIDNTRYDFAKKGASQAWDPHTLSPDRAGDVNDGEELWRKLVRKNNFALTLNGHVLAKGVGYSTDTNDCGKAVQQMWVNYQNGPLGGEGYLRLLEFLPDGKTVQARTYSPFFDTYLRDPGNQFRFEIDP